MSHTLHTQLNNLVTTLLFILIFKIGFPATVTAVANNGSWCAGSTWNTGEIPQLNDDIVIPYGVNVLINCVDNNIYSGTLSVYGSMTFSSGKGIKMDDNATVILGAGALFTGGNSGSGLWIGTSKETDCTVYEGGMQTTVVGPATCTMNVCCSFMALPTDLISFNGTVDSEGRTHLYWSTASEKDNDYFTIEYSANGVDFFHLADIQGAGTSTELLSYEWINENVNPGVSYYRLVQTDFNGQQTRYNPISVQNQAHSEILLVPNPTAGNSVVSLKAEKEQSANLLVHDFYGRVVMQTEIQIATGSNELLLPTLEWQKGFYTIMIQLEEGTQICKLLKE